MTPQSLNGPVDPIEEEEDAKTEQSECLGKEMPRSHLDDEEIVRMLEGKHDNLISNDSMFRSATPSSLRKAGYEHKRAVTPGAHSKTNSWLNETISAVEAEADVAVHEPGEERVSVNLIYKQKQQSERVVRKSYGYSQGKRDSFQTASTRKVSAMSPSKQS